MRNTTNIEDTKSRADSKIVEESLHSEAAASEVQSIDAVLAVAPVAPEWQPGRPGFLARRLIKLAGVDPHLAFKMPADEQLQMKRVGAALVFGVALQGILFGTSLTVGFGFQDWTIPVTLVICGVMWAFDTKFVAADWAAQGQALCRTYGLIPGGNWRDKWKRIGTWGIRWTVAAFIAWSLATFVEMRLFEPAIVARWGEEYRIKNRPIVEALMPRYELLLADKSQQLRLSDQRIESLTTKLNTAASGGTESTTDLDRQVSDHLERIKRLQAQKDDALQSENSQHRDVVAEKFGVRLHEGNTGLVGQGNYFNFHNDMAKEYEAIARGLSTDIENEAKALAEIRRQRATLQVTASAANRERLNTIEEHLTEERQSRARLAGEYSALQNGREEWLTARLREAPGFVPMAAGIVAELEAVAAITTGNWLIASMVFFTKILIMLLESAGPVAKVAFTAAGLYQMAVALRVHDAAEMEADRRLKWQHWRLMTRSRNHEAIDALETTQRRRATEAQARDALHKIIEKVSWMH